MISSAVLSPCGTWRYRLDRELYDEANGPIVAIIGVNPATADATINDQTIRKDLGFAKRLGWKRIIKGNKFAFRAKDIEKLRAAADPIGPENDAHLKIIMLEATSIIAAWGPLAKLPAHLRQRWRAIADIADSVGKPLLCFGVASDGHPRHTLMLSYDTPLTVWKRP